MTIKIYDTQTHMGNIYIQKKNAQLTFRNIFEQKKQENIVLIAGTQMKYILQRQHFIYKCEYYFFSLIFIASLLRMGSVSCTE